MTHLLRGTSPIRLFRPPTGSYREPIRRRATRGTLDRSCAERMVAPRGSSMAATLQAATDRREVRKTDSSRAVGRIAWGDPFELSCLRLGNGSRGERTPQSASAYGGPASLRCCVRGPSPYSWRGGGAARSPCYSARPRPGRKPPAL